jgi:hypothetical protein
LFGGDPFRIPGNVDLGDPPVAFNPIDAGVCDERAEKIGTLLGGLRWLAAFPPSG